MDPAYVEIPCGVVAMSYIQFPNPTPIFPALPSVGWSVHKKPIMSSRVITAVSGREAMLATCFFPRWAFTLTYGGDSWLRDQTQNIVPDPTLSGFTEMQQLSSLFLLCQGSYGEFFFNDPDDNSRFNLFCGITNGTNVSFTPYITWGNGPFAPSFSFPLQGANVINAHYLNGVPQSTGLITLDATRTVLTIASLAGRPGIEVTVDLSFYFRCRFLDDTLKFEEFDQNLWELKEIRFESVKP